ncbi:MAG: DUF4093 domain-containing protein [Clostridia bacterium]|nr:DUF4093 domain-containing protein [Clostridia bacterium]
MIHLEQAIIVEGKYDKIKLGQIFDAVIVATEGFGIFSNAEKLEYLRTLARTCGIIVFTDPDGAGLVIRNHIKSTVQEGKIYHAYVPDIPGKEKRKRTPGKAGLLGVEGVPNELIIDAVLSCGIEESHVQREKITKNDLFELGLSGHPNSTGLRKALAARLRLPSNLSANGLLDAINLLCTRPELEAILAELNS